MTTPYRTTRFGADKKTADPGIVDDMVRQFADQYAFLRELVQNGIDAGARRIEIRLERDGDGHVRTSVADDGCGMSRATIEGPLLTLFSSSKEKDKTKIGKYGIGFVSVFALAPDHVDVVTRPSESESWRVRLFGDHSYELSAIMRSERGTTVTLFHSMGVDEFLAHVERSIAALTKWCRHASVLLDLVVFDSSDPSLSRSGSINVAMSVSGLVSASATEEGNDGMRIVASVGGGEGEKEPTFAGFYNRGLTLFESHSALDEELEGIRFKVDCSRLSHTLSRDTIKRDRAYDDVIAKVKELVRGPLLRALEAKIRDAALIAAAKAANHNEYLPLLLAILVRAFRKVRDPKRIEVPLTDPIGGAQQPPRTTMTLHDLIKASESDILIAEESTPLTRALAGVGRPVARYIAIGGCLRGLKSVQVENVDRVFSFAVAQGSGFEGGPVSAPNPELATAIARVLRAIDCPVGAVYFAHFFGAMANEPFRVIPQMASSAITRPRDFLDEEAEKKNRYWGKKATLFLNLDDAAVRLAKRRARTDVEAAAHLLVRVILVTDRAIEARAVDKLIEAAASE